MNKQVEQIKAEIERLNNKYKYLSSIEAKHKTDCYTDLLSFINSLPEEKPSEDLEKAAEEYEKGLSYYECINQWPSVGFIAGAQWQKEQMMKDAVDADVELILHDKTGDIRLHTGYLPKELGVKYGDKVKLIILKEDEK